MLETVGAEVLGGAPTTAKGVRVLRDSLAELGIPASAYLPRTVRKFIDTAHAASQW